MVDRGAGRPAARDGGGGPRRRRHGRGTPARCGGATGHEGACRGHGRAAWAMASPMHAVMAALGEPGSRATRGLQGGGDVSGEVM